MINCHNFAHINMPCKGSTTTGDMCPYLLWPTLHERCKGTDLDSSAGLNIVCCYAQTVQLKFRNVQSKRRNCAVTVNRYTVIWSAVYLRVRDSDDNAQIFRPSVFSNTEFPHSHINVGIISHATHQFHSNSASYNTFQ